MAFAKIVLYFISINSLFLFQYSDITLIVDNNRFSAHKVMVDVKNLEGTFRSSEGQVHNLEPRHFQHFVFTLFCFSFSFSIASTWYKT